MDAMDRVNDEARQAMLLDRFFDHLAANPDAVAPVGLATGMADFGRLVMAVERIPPQAALSYSARSRL